MSTYMYLECLDHDPPLRAEDESGQHLYDLKQLRADIASREAIVEAWDLNIQPADYFRVHTARFLVGHRKCRLGIVDEYGKRHSIEEEAEIQ